MSKFAPLVHNCDRFAGKVWKKKEEKTKLHEDDALETEWDEVLATATEEDLVDLAGEYFILYLIIFFSRFIGANWLLVQT